jgi:hypothetical protein
LPTEKTDFLGVPLEVASPVDNQYFNQISSLGKKTFSGWLLFLFDLI